MSDEFAWRATRLGVAQICETAGFEQTSSAAFDVLSEIYIAFVKKLGKRCKVRTEDGNRCETNLQDLHIALNDLGMRVVDHLHLGKDIAPLRIMPNDSATFVAPRTEPLPRYQHRTDAAVVEVPGSSKSIDAAPIATTKPDVAIVVSQQASEEVNSAATADTSSENPQAQRGESELPASEEEESGDDDEDDEIEGEDNESEPEDDFYGIKFRTIAEVGETIPNWLPPFPTIVEKPVEDTTVSASTDKPAARVSADGEAEAADASSATSRRSRQSGDGLEGRDVFDDPFGNEYTLNNVIQGQTNGGLAELQQQRMMNNMGSHQQQPNNGAGEVLSFSDDEDFQRRISYDGPNHSVLETGGGGVGRSNGGRQGLGMANLLLVPNTPPELSGEDSDDLSASSDDENIDPNINVKGLLNTREPEKPGRSDKNHGSRHRRGDVGAGGGHKGHEDHEETGSFRRTKESAFGQSQGGSDDDNWSDGSEAPLRPKKPLAMTDSKRGLRDAKGPEDKEKENKDWEGDSATQTANTADAHPEINGDDHKSRGPEAASASNAHKEGNSTVVHLTKADGESYSVSDSPAGSKKGVKTGGATGKDRKHRSKDKDREKIRDKDRDRATTHEAATGGSGSGVSTNDKSAKNKRSSSPTKSGNRSKNSKTSDKRLPIRPDGSDAIALSGSSDKVNEGKESKDKKISLSPRPPLTMKIKSPRTPSPNPSQPGAGAEALSKNSSANPDTAGDKDLLQVHLRGANGKDEGKRANEAHHHRREKKRSRSPSKSPRPTHGGSPIPPHSPAKKDRDSSTSKHTDRKGGHRENKGKSDSTLKLSVKEPAADEGKESGGERSTKDRSRDRSKDRNREKDRDKEKRHRERDKGVKSNLASPQKPDVDGRKSPQVTIGVPKSISSSKESEMGDKAKKRDKPAKEKSSFGAALSAAVAGTASPQVHTKEKHKSSTKSRPKTGNRSTEGEGDKHGDRDKDKDRDRDKDKGQGKDKERERGRESVSLKVKLVRKPGEESPRKRPTSPAEGGTLKVKLGGKSGGESPRKRPLSPADPHRRQADSGLSEEPQQAPKKRMKLMLGSGGKSSDKGAEHGGSSKHKRSASGDIKSSSGSSPSRRHKHATEQGRESSERSLKRGGSLSPNPAGVHKKKHRSRSPSPKVEGSGSGSSPRPTHTGHKHSPRIDGIRDSPVVSGTSPRPVSGEGGSRDKSGVQEKSSKGAGHSSSSNKNIVKDGKIRIKASSGVPKESSADREKGRERGKERERDKDKDRDTSRDKDGKDNKDRPKHKERNRDKTKPAAPSVDSMAGAETGADTPGLSVRSRRSSATYVTNPIDKPSDTGAKTGSSTGDSRNKGSSTTDSIKVKGSSKSKHGKDRERSRSGAGAKSPAGLERHPSLSGSNSRPLFVVGAKKEGKGRDTERERDRDTSAGDASMLDDGRETKEYKSELKPDEDSTREERARSDGLSPTGSGGADEEHVDEDELTFAAFLPPSGEVKEKSKKKKKEKKEKKDKKRKKERTLSRSPSPPASPAFSDPPPAPKVSLKLKISQPDAPPEAPIHEPVLLPPEPTMPIEYNCVKCPLVDTPAMICCDACEKWYHFHCVNLTQAEVDSIEQYYCKDCKRKMRHKR